VVQSYLIIPKINCILMVNVEKLNVNILLLNFTYPLYALKENWSSY